MVKECTTVNGNATLVLNEATFADCIILQSVMMEEAKKVKDRYWGYGYKP